MPVEPEKHADFNHITEVWHSDYYDAQEAEIKKLRVENKKLSEILMKVRSALENGTLDQVRTELDEIAAQIGKDMWREMLGGENLDS